MASFSRAALNSIHSPDAVPATDVPVALVVGTRVMPEWNG
jgi:hypothetical protein